MEFPKTCISNLWQDMRYPPSLTRYWPLGPFLFPVSGAQTWPGRSSQIPGSGGGSRTSTVPLPSWGSSSPLTLQTKSWVKMRRFAWQWGTSTSWSRSWGSKPCSKQEWLLRETFWDSSPKDPTCRTGLYSVTTRFLHLTQATALHSGALAVITQGALAQKLLAVSSLLHVPMSTGWIICESCI